MNSRKVEEYLKRLKKHRDFLEEKLETKEEHKSHYLRAELQALEWSIRYIEDTLLAAADHYYKYSNEMRQDEQS